MVTMPHWPMSPWTQNLSPGLERIKAMLKALGNPELKVPPVIHIAGTNGKGSTSAFLRAMFEADGHKVHLFTSPHLVHYNERIVLGSEQISDSYLEEIMEETRIATDPLGLPITLFEGTTAAAFLAFARQPADVLILETGMGGRLDCTNVIDHPEITVITPISFDHVAFLGDTLAKIASEKAGIIKPSAKCVLSAQTDESYLVFQQKSEELGIELIAYEYDYGAKRTSTGWQFLSPNFTQDLPMPNLVGEHQIMNASTAIATAINLPSFRLSREAIIQGTQSARWPARLQQITAGNLFSTLPPGWELWIDGAHNEAGAQVLSVWAESKQDMPLYLISGMTKGRDSERFFHYFVNKVAFICGVRVETEASSHSSDYIATSAQRVGIPAASCHSVSEAILTLCNLTDGKARILVCGSLYLAGQILQIG